MQVKKITAKIRDMVKVSLMENGDERAWYNNIEMPDAIKELEMKDFHFHVLGDGKIEFQIHFAQGILPQELPEKKARKHRESPAVGTKQATPTPATIVPEAETKQADKPMTPIAKPENKADAKITATTATDSKPAPAKTSKHATSPAPTKKTPAKPEPKPTAKKAI